ncbi:MAG: hypothetical protein M1818_004263 [Claussenomyces sp. TS43310]|nr:MAG: hypothetical protein M1818_004263 [Claussenomyces sp. TS43310]
MSRMAVPPIPPIPQTATSPSTTYLCPSCPPAATDRAPPSSLDPFIYLPRVSQNVFQLLGITSQFQSLLDQDVIQSGLSEKVDIRERHPLVFPAQNRRYERGITSDGSDASAQWVSEGHIDGEPVSNMKVSVFSDRKRRGMTDADFRMLRDAIITCTTVDLYCLEFKLRGMPVSVFLEHIDRVTNAMAKARCDGY